MPFKAWRWDRLSLRNKLTIVNITLLTFGIVVAGIGTTLLLRPTLVSQTDSQLSVYASDPTQFLAADPSSRLITYDAIRIAPSTIYVAVLDADGQVVVDNWGQWQRPQAIAPEVPADAAVRGSQSLFDMEDPLGATWRTITVPEGEYAADQVRGTLLIAAPLTSVNATMVNFLAIFFGFGLTVVIFGAALTRVLVSATLLPLRQVEATAMQFASGDYSQRLPAGTPNTEVGRLSRSLNTMLVRIDHAFDERTRTIAQMRRFVGDASHELRTPLVTVRGYAELYRMGALNDPEKVGQAMERIEKEALRMGGLVEDLLQLARLDETRELVKDVIDLEPIAEDAAMDAHATAKDRVVRALPVNIIQETRDEAEPLGSETTGELPAAVEADIVPAEESASAPEGAAAKRALWRRRSLPRPALRGFPIRRKGAEPSGIETADSDEDLGDVPAMVHANEDKVRQAISNLLGNAMRYTPEGSPLEVGVTVDLQNQLAIVDIIDHGEGIPPQIRQKIFERFWRADTSRARETGGSGLGLSIVSAIMKAHDGEVDVLETPGGGATFRLKFPLLMSAPVDSALSTAPNS
ncbi:MULTISPECIES: sensor histidine kinase [unclassified Pseudoclavibacter]|uniref:sensor histidine kinase n=1 Tax=unclassified Pseudoclavibacter TaxID=2615177 RepID=UPI000CE72F40|nr:MULTISPECIES: ATP-binding protein [unclassified Pseudoclavibacter]MBF4549997.1 HAMP domain-containing protein [Pseudoclavibacter sp. VKM Ac-2888]PPG03282.1 sensor histidine kinase [Pseudoclavibacter sp. RFBI5]